MWMRAFFDNQRTALAITRGSPAKRFTMASSKPATAASASVAPSIPSAIAFRSTPSPFLGFSTRTASKRLGSADSPDSCLTRRVKRSITRCEFDLRIAWPSAGSDSGVDSHFSTRASFCDWIACSAFTAAASAHKLASSIPLNSSRRYRAKKGGEYPCSSRGNAIRKLDTSQRPRRAIASRSTAMKSVHSRRIRFNSERPIFSVKGHRHQHAKPTTLPCYLLQENVDPQLSSR